MTYTLLIEKERNTPEENIGKFTMFFNQFFSAGKLERCETENEIIISGFNVSRIAWSNIQSLRKDGATGAIRLLEVSDEKTKEIRVSPALPMSEAYSETKEKYKSLHKVIRQARMKCANVTEEMLKHSDISPETHRAMIIADSVFPDFKIGQVVTIKDLLQYGADFTEYGDQKQSEICGVDESGSLIRVVCTYELAHPMPDGYQFKHREEYYYKIEVEVTDIQSGYEGKMDTQ